MSQLDENDCFEAGHLSEAAMALLADGENGLVAREAVEHAAACEACGAAIGEAALASAEVHAAFATLPERHAAASSRGGAAWAIGSGLLVAALASAPSLSGLARGLAEVRHALEVLVSVSMQTEQALRTASGRLESVRSGATWLASFTLVAVGLWIARRGPSGRGTATEIEEEAR